MQTWKILLALLAVILLVISLSLMLWANQPSARWSQTFLVSEFETTAQPVSMAGYQANTVCLFPAVLLVAIFLIALGISASADLRARGRQNLKWLGLVIGGGVLLASCCCVIVVAAVVITPQAGVSVPAETALTRVPATSVLPAAPTMVASPTAAMTTRPPLPLAPTPVSTPFFEERLFEERTVELEWPESIRLGDSDLIRLTFSPRPEGGLTPTVEFEGHRVEPEALTIPDLSATHYTFAIARLDAAGFDVQPGGTQERELMLGQPLTYRWTLKARDAGQHRVALSLTLRWEPKAGVNERVRTATVWDRALEIQVRTALGLSGPMSDWLGVGGSTLGTVLGLPFLETILTGLWKRWRRRGA